MSGRTFSPTARLLLVAGLLLPCTSCAGLRGHRDRKVPQYGVVEPNLPRELQKVSMPRHVVEPPDELEISIKPSSLGLDRRTVIVQPDGTIDLDFFGDLYVAGLTIDEVEAKLDARFTAEAMRQDIGGTVQSSVRLLDGAHSKRYYVLGTVSNQGSFPITGNETVLDGILQAGLRAHSLPEKASLVRPHPAGGPDQVFAIDWCGITQRGDTTTNYQLLPGDRIIVPGGKEPGLIRTLIGG
jgi:polysaccharide export outer membrane protein